MMYLYTNLYEYMNIIYIWYSENWFIVYNLYGNTIFIIDNYEWQYGKFGHSWADTPAGYWRSVQPGSGATCGADW